MPKKSKKKIDFYLDANIVIDYASDRNRDTIRVLDKIKEKGWGCLSSSLLVMELADYKKDYTKINKGIIKKTELRKIIRDINQVSLQESDFNCVYEWFEDFQKEYNNLKVYDFMNTNDAWQMAQHISFHYDLSAPDIIHLTSAILAGYSGACNFIITNDGKLREEGNKILSDNKIKSKLKILTISEVNKKYFQK